MTSLRRAVLATILACTALRVAAAPGAGGGPPERRLELRTIAAAPANRAAVIVDKGDGSAPTKVCIRFDANAISGEEALRLAAAEDPAIAPVFADFSGKGKAVCALCGVGCPSGDCFCDPSRYWAYSRAEAGSGAFSASPVGVSSSQVTDGDVEGYRWGSGAAPALVDLRSICGEVPPATTTTAPPPPPPPAASAAFAPSRRRPGGVAAERRPEHLDRRSGRRAPSTATTGRRPRRRGHHHRPACAGNGPPSHRGHDHHVRSHGRPGGDGRGGRGGERRRVRRRVGGPRGRRGVGSGPTAG